MYADTFNGGDMSLPSVEELKSEIDRINKLSDELRKRSGSVDSDDKLVGFLYVILRDHLTPGVVENILLRHCSSERTQYSNGWLAEYAEDIANRLREDI